MRKRLLFILFVLLTAASCKKSDLQDITSTPTGLSTIKANISSISGPTTALAGQEVSYQITWANDSTYSSFHAFKTDSLNKVSSITLYVDSSSCKTCTVKGNTATYKFKPAATGTYFLKFAGRDSLHTIVDTLVVK